jgi:hypothetical protein
MVERNLALKITSIETQLELLKNTLEKKGKNKKRPGLCYLEGILKGKGKFTEEEIEAVKARFKNKI